MNEATDMSELELLVALRLGETEFTKRYGMCPADAAIAARAVREVIVDLWCERAASRKRWDEWVTSITSPTAGGGNGR